MNMMAMDDKEPLQLQRGTEMAGHEYHHLMALLCYSFRRFVITIMFGSQDYVENSTSAYNIKMYSPHTYILSSQYAIAVAVIVTADRYVYSKVASGHFIVHPPIQPKQENIYVHTPTTILTPQHNERISICGLGCVNGTKP